MKYFYLHIPQYQNQMHNTYKKGLRRILGESDTWVGDETNQLIVYWVHQNYVRKKTFMIFQMKKC